MMRQKSIISEDIDVLLHVTQQMVNAVNISQKAHAAHAEAQKALEDVNGDDAAQVQKVTETRLAIDDTKAILDDAIEAFAAEAHVANETEDLFILARKIYDAIIEARSRHDAYDTALAEGNCSAEYDALVEASEVLDALVSEFADQYGREEEEREETPPQSLSEELENAAVSTESGQLEVTGNVPHTAE